MFSTRSATLTSRYHGIKSLHEPAQFHVTTIQVLVIVCSCQKATPMLV